MSPTTHRRRYAIAVPCVLALTLGVTAASRAPRDPAPSPPADAAAVTVLAAHPGVAPWQQVRTGSTAGSPRDEHDLTGPSTRRDTAGNDSVAHAGHVRVTVARTSPPSPSSTRSSTAPQSTNHRASTAPKPAERRTNTPHPAPTHTTGTTHSAPKAAGSSSSQIAYAVLDLLNSERRDHGLAPLRMNSQLISSAHAHNLAMARHNQMSHQLPGEAPFTSRISSAGYRWSSAGENVGWNSQMTTSAALTLERIMYNEKPPNDGHRQNILSKSYRDVGIDIYLDTTHHKLWLTQDFGSH